MTRKTGIIRSFLWQALFLVLVGCVAFSSAFSSALCAAAAPVTKNTSIKPGQPWPDTDGVHINAHGFCILSHEGKYYWYGAHKIAGKNENEKNEAGVRCYVSTDLLNWSNAGMVLDVFAPGAHAELRDAFILDRPKVIFHAATKRFILYFKLYPPKEQGGKTGKDFAYVGVATAPTPTGPFEYQGRFLGAGSETGSGDFAIYQDTDGAVYHIAVRKPDKGRKDKPLVCGRLSEDGLRPVGDYFAMAGVTNATEGPALFRRAGRYFLLGSDSTGWNPNPARIFVADHLTGPYKFLGNPCRGVNPHNQKGPEKTFGGQSTFVFPLPGKPDEWIAMFDINKPEDPVNAGYIWLPLKFEADNPVIEWRTEWTPESSERPKFKSKIHIPVKLARDTTALPPPGYQMVFNDEFEGEALDANRWGYRLEAKMLSAQQRENVSVKNGNLVIALRKESVRGKNYTGGGVISRQKFVYGYYEARFKTPPAEGWHTAFWAMRHRFGDTTAPLPRLELDFCEQDGGDPHFFSFGIINQSRYHQIKNRQSWNAGRWVIEDAPDTSAEFHVWGCEFTPETTRFYFDGKLAKEVRSSGFPHDEMNVWFSVIASTLKGDRWVDESKLPNAIYCDYIRVYQHPKYREAEAAVRAEVLRPLPPLDTKKVKTKGPKPEDLN